MTDKLSLYNGALRIVGERETTLTENREPRRLLDAAWSNGKGAINGCLEAGQWLFATRTVVMEPETGITPDFGYQYAFQKPPDWIRTCSISADEYQSEQLTRFRDEGGYWWADCDKLYISYISDDEDYGQDMSLWPQSFIDYVENYLASKIVGRIQNSITTAAEIKKDMKRALSDAQGKNAVSRPTAFMSRGSWVRARGGAWSSRNRDRSR